MTPLTSALKAISFIILGYGMAHASLEKGDIPLEDLSFKTPSSMVQHLLDQGLLTAKTQDKITTYVTTAPKDADIERRRELPVDSSSIFMGFKDITADCANPSVTQIDGFHGPIVGTSISPIIKAKQSFAFFAWEREDSSLEFAFNAPLASMEINEETYMACRLRSCYFFDHWHHTIGIVDGSGALVEVIHIQRDGNPHMEIKDSILSTLVEVAIDLLKTQEAQTPLYAFSYNTEAKEKQRTGYGTTFQQVHDFFLRINIFSRIPGIIK